MDGHGHFPSSKLRPRKHRHHPPRQQPSGLMSAGSCGYAGLGFSFSPFLESPVGSFTRGGQVRFGNLEYSRDAPTFVPLRRLKPNCRENQIAHSCERAKRPPGCFKQPMPLYLFCMIPRTDQPDSRKRLDNSVSSTLELRGTGRIRVNGRGLVARLAHGYEWNETGPLTPCFSKIPAAPGFPT